MIEYLEYLRKSLLAVSKMCTGRRTLLGLVFILSAAPLGSSLQPASPQDTANAYWASIEKIYDAKYAPRSFDPAAGESRLVIRRRPTFGPEWQVVAVLKNDSDDVKLDLFEASAPVWYQLEQLKRSGNPSSLTQIEVTVSHIERNATFIVPKIRKLAKVRIDPLMKPSWLLDGTEYSVVYETSGSAIRMKLPFRVKNDPNAAFIQALDDIFVAVKRLARK